MSQNIFTSKLTGRETSALKESLKSTKVDEGKCEDDTGISSLSSASYFIFHSEGYRSHIRHRCHSP
jgi:hypothetical protein